MQIVIRTIVPVETKAIDSSIVGTTLVVVGLVDVTKKPTPSH